MKRFNILFIDDTEGDNNFIRLLIEIHKLPVNPHFEISGHNALKYLSSLPPDKFPEILIVDINMPLMDGFEFISEFKKQFYPKHKKVIIFMMSSSHRLSEIERAKSTPSIVDYIQKPMTKEIFEQKFLEITENVQPAE